MEALVINLNKVVSVLWSMMLLVNDASHVYGDFVNTI